MNFNINKMTAELKSELISLQSEMKEFKVAHQGFDSGLSNLLEIIAEDIGKNPEPKKLQKQASGIFRLVTDNLALQKSDVGKKVMEFRLKLKEFADLLGEDN